MMSGTGLIPLIIGWLIMAVPTALVANRAGMSPWWNAFQILPLWGTIILWWIIAFVSWPRLRDAAPKPEVFS
ncbi:hypothetical protein K1T73_11060 [Roseovarius sp. SCSIO 43702]|uniref:hypothetical protein n=1 Tax=Roseovarius sp. SCSIO 43702 TaxID=2823043 RepID=UPI001C73A9CF|nr:hypothetical protein [Roseovarius sp. SCSIO 43702]QYX55627.1 hypothetical protein K1T73_11060 [Roseovarius sp. SCSIO 43702]